jgi:predicted nucleotidyltransferase
MKQPVQNINHLLKSFKTDLQNLYRKRFNNLILFGSYSRDEATQYSDIDLLLVLNDEKLLPYEEIDFTNELVFKYIIQYEKQISIVPTTKQQFEEKNNPLFINIRKEGISI